MDEKGLKEVNIFGYSMGGYVAMYIAKHYPHKIFKVVTLATKFHWDEHIATRETQMLDPHQIEIKVSFYADALKQRHGHNEWILVLQRTCEMLLEMGKNNTLKKEDYTSIYTPILLLLGDRDKMVSYEETLNVYKDLSNGQMGVLPNTPHPIEKVDTSLLSFFIKRFI